MADLMVILGTVHQLQVVRPPSVSKYYERAGPPGGYRWSDGSSLDSHWYERTEEITMWVSRDLCTQEDLSRCFLDLWCADEAKRLLLRTLVGAVFQNNLFNCF